MFNNWVHYSRADAELEYRVEYTLKGNFGNMFPTFADFYKALSQARKEVLDKTADSKIAYRSRTQSKEALLNLIRGYASYPQYRNEDTINNLYKGFETNAKMKMPIVLEFKNGNRRIFAGNTRLDVAFQLGIKPKVLILKEPK